MSTTLLLIATVVAIAILLAAWSPSRTKRLFTGYKMARNVVLLVIVVIVAPVLIGTGYLPAMLFGAGMIVIAVWTFWFGPLNEPDTPL